MSLTIESAAKAKDSSDGTSAASAGSGVDSLFFFAYPGLFLHVASVELKTDRLDLVLDFCEMLCDSAALPFVQALVIRVADDFLKRISTACPHLLFFSFRCALCF